MDQQALDQFSIEECRDLKLLLERHYLKEDLAPAESERLALIIKNIEEWRRRQDCLHNERAELKMVTYLDLVRKKYTSPLKSNVLDAKRLAILNSEIDAGTILLKSPIDQNIS